MYAGKVLKTSMLGKNISYATHNQCTSLFLTTFSTGCFSTITQTPSDYVMALALCHWINCIEVEVDLEAIFSPEITFTFTDVSF